MHTTLYLARHGETLWNQQKKLQGQLDSPLTPQGQQQALTLAQQLTRQRIDKILSSPLGRARDTAAICAATLQCPHDQEVDLQERSFGAWQGQQKHQLIAQGRYSDALDQLTEVAPPEGESALTCAARLNQALKRIASAHPQQRLLVISHGDIIRCFCKQLQATGLPNIATSTLANCECLPLEYCHHTATFALSA